MTGSPRKDRAAVTGPRALVAVVVVALAGGAIGIGLGLRGHTSPIVGAAKTAAAASEPAGSTSIPVPTKPPVVAVPIPTPWQAPSAIAYVGPGSVSFPTASDGWVLGDACDAQQDCETGVARTTDGGASWAMVASPAAPDPTNSELYLAAASSEDAWVWGTGTDGDAVFGATHDGGESWQPADVGGEVVDLAIAGGTAWAVTGCAEGATTACPEAVLSSPVGGGPWTDLAPLPASVQGEPISNSALGGPELVRWGSSAWQLNDNESEPTLVRTEDQAQSWVSMTVPCTVGATMSLAASSTEDLMLSCADIGGPSSAPQEVWTSDDGGAQWLLRSRADYSGFSPPATNVGSLDNGGGPIGLAVLSGSRAWMINYLGPPLITDDGGVTWTQASLPEELTTVWQGGGEVDVAFADSTHGWVFGSAGLWATTDGGADWQYQPIIGPVPAWSPST